MYLRNTEDCLIYIWTHAIIASADEYILRGLCTYYDEYTNNWWNIFRLAIRIRLLFCFWACEFSEPGIRRQRAVSGHQRTRTTRLLGGKVVSKTDLVLTVCAKGIFLPTNKKKSGINRNTMGSEQVQNISSGHADTENAPPRSRNWVIYMGRWVAALE